MTQPNCIRRVKYSERFKSEYKGLRDYWAEIDKAIAGLTDDPMPKRLRFHKLGGYRRPSLYTVDVVGNKAYKISLEIDGDTAILRRVSTHREIDRAP